MTMTAELTLKYQPVIYLSNIPSDMTEAHISTFIAQSPPEKIDFQHHVPVNERLRPDQYYDWMPRHGVLHFSSLVAGELILRPLRRAWIRHS
jgi:hypothetical protein